MANYLPVLLVSVAANSIPDDSAVSTLPRGQVDYLSHNWEEEDVWRSWRNMTRQKNEIANGVRLENASWRTWWKQRNGLGTVTPETLNWLKDSDVTWLYGPLHTAVDWTPPPKPLLEADRNKDSLNVDIPLTHKPILKHRSISQLLTSDLPTSPVFSPAESEDDTNVSKPIPLHIPEEPGGKRPSLVHTKSDTHITRWGSNRAFRKDSPPRIDPNHQQIGVNVSSSDTNTLEGASSPNPSDGSVPPNARQALNGSGHASQSKRRHISFNTFVEQCIAIEKPKKGNNSDYDEDDDDEDEEDLPIQSGRYPYGRNAWGYDDGYEEDEEEDSGDEDETGGSLWDDRYNDSAIAGSDSDSYDGDEGVGDEEDEADDQDVIQIRSSSYNPQPALSDKPSRSRSKISSVSSSSASTSTSTNSSEPPAPRRRRKPAPPSRRLSSSTSSTYRPRFHYIQPNPSSSRRRSHGIPSQPPASLAGRTSPPQQPVRVTIAPIAPTILKTGGYGYGDDSGWTEGFGDEGGGSDDGLWSGGRWWQGSSESRSGAGSKREMEDDVSTPVELVYVPPYGDHYRDWVDEHGQGRGRSGGTHGRSGREVREVLEDHEDGFGNGERGMYKRRSGPLFSIGTDDDEIDADDVLAGAANAPNVQMPPPTASHVRSLSMPVVIRTTAEGTRITEDMEEHGSKDRVIVSSKPIRSGTPRDEPCHSPSRSRSRSRSKSRTPSPAIISPSSTAERVAGVASSASSGAVLASGPGLGSASLSSPNLPRPASQRRRSLSASPPPSSSKLLSPPRGRVSSSHQDLPAQAQPRGRSATRANSSLSDRERDRGASAQGSPLGSLSPDGMSIGVATAYASGRLDRERERERERKTWGTAGAEERRGRDRTGKRLSQSLSPDEVKDALMGVSPASAAASIPLAAQAVSSSTSASSTTTATPSISVVIPSRKDIDDQTQTQTQPTPANSPVTPFRYMPTPISEQDTKAPAPSPSPRQHTRSSSAADSDSLSSSSTSPTPKPRSVKSPLSVSAPLPAEPSTSFNISPREEEQPSLPSPTFVGARRKSPATSPTRGAGHTDGDTPVTFVGKAVGGIVSSAGAFLGLWHHHHNHHASTSASSDPAPGNGSRA